MSFFLFCVNLQKLTFRDTHSVGDNVLLFEFLNTNVTGANVMFEKQLNTIIGLNGIEKLTKTVYIFLNFANFTILSFEINNISLL